jgi:bifunctional DNA primase/polymerase-like protein
MTPLGLAAIALGARGLRVFPCWPRRKEPAVKDNLRLAAVDETVIRRFWGEEGRYNVAVATGRASGIWILDIDAEDGGERTLRELEATHGELPKTVEVITGAGRHLYWKWPDGIEIRNAQSRDDLPGVDWRGEGGYCLAPPSIHPTGRAYAWSVDSASEFADAPAWLISIVTERSARQSGTVAPALPSGWEALLEREHEGSHRAAAVTRCFGYLARKYCDPAVAAAFVDFFNQVKCKPPLDHDEVVRICRDIAAREAERRAREG